MKPFVITVSRQFASMGRSISQSLAHKLGINFYDRDIVEETAKRIGLPVSHISKLEELYSSSYLKRMFPLGTGAQSVQDEIFMTQKNIIRDIAQKESCIIVGRCANTILMDHERSLSVYIYAPKDERLKNCVEKLEMDEKSAKHTLESVDKARNAYCAAYGNYGENPFDNHQIMLDSSHFGIEGTADILASIARSMFGLS
jgi:hypothetical protein